MVSLRRSARRQGIAIITWLVEEISTESQVQRKSSRQSGDQHRAYRVVSDSSALAAAP